MLHHCVHMFFLEYTRLLIILLICTLYTVLIRGIRFSQTATGYRLYPYPDSKMVVQNPDLSEHNIRIAVRVPPKFDVWLTFKMS